MTKPRQCTNGPRHSWQWVKNVTVTRGTLSHVQISAKGLYRCACGERKYGPHNHNATEAVGR